MFETQTVLIAGLLFLGSILYTSVGHAGASVYIAIMTTFDLPPILIKPTALTLNIFVSSYASFRYIRSGFFHKGLFYNLVIGSVPAAFIGGQINLSSQVYKPIIGVLLVFSGMSFLFRWLANSQEKRRVNPLLAICIGAGIGLLSGVTGTGGGVFLSPLIIWFGWVSVKEASGTVAAFIFVNSVSGLLGNFQSTLSLPSELPIFLFSVILGAFIGTRLGISIFSSTQIKRALGLVLIIAGAKFIFAP